jgi:hypothetical protein
MNSPCASRTQQSGQVLAEAVVVMLLLVALIWALHQTGRWQYQWSSDWLKTQVMATGWSLDHDVRVKGMQSRAADRQVWRDWVMADFGIGHAHWQTLRLSGRFSKTAWRVAGAGQASQDAQVNARIQHAPRLWLRQALVSQTTARTLLPSITAVDMPWRDRGSATNWLGQWQGSTPEAYLEARQ